MKFLIPVNIIMAAAILFISYSLFNSSRKIVYVNTGDVFNEFQMTKEKDSEIKSIEEKKQGAVDSLAGVIEKIKAGVIKLDDREFDLLKREYITKRSQYSEDISKLKQASIDKIWKQINQYISDYGKENDIDVILGANGQGSLMYAKERIDVSKEVSNYINKRYAGLQ